MTTTSGGFEPFKNLLFDILVIIAIIFIVFQLRSCLTKIDDTPSSLTTIKEAYHTVEKPIEKNPTPVLTVKDSSYKTKLDSIRRIINRLFDENQKLKDNVAISNDDYNTMKSYLLAQIDSLSSKNCEDINTYADTLRDSSAMTISFFKTKGYCLERSLKMMWKEKQETTTNVFPDKKTRGPYHVMPFVYSTVPSKFDFGVGCAISTKRGFYLGGHSAISQQFLVGGGLTF